MFAYKVCSLENKTLIIIMINANVVLSVVINVIKPNFLASDKFIAFDKG